VSRCYPRRRRNVLLTSPRKRGRYLDRPRCRSSSRTRSRPRGSLARFLRSETKVLRLGIARVFIFVCAIALVGCTETLSLSVIMPQLHIESYVPLDVILEAELVTRSNCLGGYGCRTRFSPVRAESVCRPAGSCVAETVHLGGEATMSLRVIGLKPGPVVVTVRYQQPDQADASAWQTLTLPLTFVADRGGAASLSTGMPVPKSLARFDQVPKALAPAGIQQTAMCEALDEYRVRFACFAPERWSGIARYPSCAFTGRCAASEPPLGGFFADVQWDDEGLVEQIDLTYVNQQAETLNTTIRDKSAPGDK
jgi:hypothetical protein